MSLLNISHFNSLLNKHSKPTFFIYKVLLIITGISVLNSCGSFSKTKIVDPKNNDQYIMASAVKYDRKNAEALGAQYAISTQGIYATKAAQDTLKKGGNLIDAFVAASFVISVERPQSTGIGGGGFLVFKEAKSNQVYAVDFRERAPIKARRDMYLDKNNNYQEDLSKDGILSVAVPGMVKGLWEVHQKFGKLKWAQVLEPSISLADNGFTVYEYLENALKDRKDVIIKDPEASKIFLDKKKNILSNGQLLVQKDLANTLRIIAKKGANDFYSGSIADKIVKFSNERKGLITKDDLKKYTVKWRTPVSTDFLDYKVYSMPPPSSGGIHVIQFLNFLENERWNPGHLNQASALHIEAATLQSAFADRAVYLGDPDFTPVPIEKLTSKNYAQKRRSEIPNDEARSDQDVQAGVVDLPKKAESTETTHMSLMDAEGNIISSTQTINGWMGSAVVVPKTGILLNNEMDDFSAKPGTANMFGAVGGDANSIAPQKTPLSSMSPTIILDKNSKPVMSLGAPGGTKIISCTAQTIFNHLFFKLPLWESVTNIRYHHQWKPNKLFIEEPGPKLDEKNKLLKMGYTLDISSVPCKVMAISFENNKFTAVADPRDIGTSLAE